MFDTCQFAWFDGGASHIGTSRPEIPDDGEGPKRPVKLKPFGLAKKAVTNAEFAEFVLATGYETDAERLGWSFVFRGLTENNKGPSPPGLQWWNAVNGASWDRPLGPDSDISDIQDHPVVHVSFLDASHFSEWAGVRLPSEAEWEHAARAGVEDGRYPWGDAEPNDDEIFCNIWQGSFPDHNTVADGFYGTCPVDAFAPNPAGIYNLSGNVWEWCADPFRVRSLKFAAKSRNAGAKNARERVIKGGSFLCHRKVCWRYRIAARMGRQPDNGSSNVGFRIASTARDGRAGPC